MKFFNDSRLKINNIKKKNFHINTKINLYNNLSVFITKKLLNSYVNFFFKNGLKKKIKLQLLKSFNLFFLFFSNNDISWDIYQKQIFILKNGFFLNLNFFKINIIFKYLVHLLNPLFDLSCYNIPQSKNRRQKKQNGHIYKFKYLKVERREKRAIKWLYLYSLNFNDKLFFKKIFKSLFFTFLDGKNSFLYKKKIQIYSRILSKQRQLN